MKTRTRRTLVGAAALCAIGMGSTATAPSASAWSTAPAPYYSLTDRATCDRVNNASRMMTAVYRLPIEAGQAGAGHKGDAELRVRFGLGLGVSSPTVCSYVLDNSPGNSRMENVLVRDLWQTRAVDSAVYTTYAGALHVKGPGAARSWRVEVWGRAVVGTTRYGRWITLHISNGQVQLTPVPDYTY